MVEVDVQLLSGFEPLPNAFVASFLSHTPGHTPEISVMLVPYFA